MEVAVEGGRGLRLTEFGGGCIDFGGKALREERSGWRPPFHVFVFSDLSFMFYFPVTSPSHDSVPR